MKSDKTKNRARDQYVVLSHVPNKPEITVQKLGSVNNRSNVLTVQLQNVYKLPCHASQHTTLQAEKSCKGLDEEFPKHQPCSSDDFKDNPDTEDNAYVELPNCFYCINMKKPDISHEDSDCVYLLEIKTTKSYHP